MLKTLATWLKINGHSKAAQQVEELDWNEPWHEEAVKEFGDTIEEEIEQPINEDAFLEPIDKNHPKVERANSSYTVYKKILEHENFKLVGKSSPNVIGAGGYGIVFEGIWNGKPAVAKVTTNYIGEVKIWEKIFAIREQASPIVRKHLPEIYYMNAGEIPNVITDYEIIIMEKLYPLPSNIKLMMQGIFKDRDFESIKSEESLWNIAQNIYTTLVKEYKRNNIPLEWKYVDLVSPARIFKILYEDTTGHKITLPIKKIRSSIMTYLREECFDFYDGFVNSQILQTFITTILSNEFGPESFPMSGDVDAYNQTSFWKNVPEFSGVYQTLKELMDNFQITWMDVHYDNLMIDKNGEIKIIDVGLYDTN